MFYYLFDSAHCTSFIKTGAKLSVGRGDGGICISAYSHTDKNGKETSEVNRREVGAVSHK